MKNLPPSSHKFWEGAEKIVSKPKHEKCSHYFERGRLGTVMCKKCNIGYLFSGKEYLKKGHIYIGKRLVF